MAVWETFLSCLHVVTIVGDSMVNKMNQVPRADTPVWEVDSP